MVQMNNKLPSQPSGSLQSSGYTRGRALGTTQSWEVPCAAPDFADGDLFIHHFLPVFTVVIELWWRTQVHKIVLALRNKKFTIQGGNFSRPLPSSSVLFMCLYMDECGRVNLMIFKVPYKFNILWQKDPRFIESAWVINKPKVDAKFARCSKN